MIAARYHKELLERQPLTPFRIPMPDGKSGRLIENVQPPPVGARAFTLIELLVVIAIIAILAALLLPALSAAKQQGSAVVDISNVKQMVMSLAMYCNQSQDDSTWSNWLAGDSTNRQGWLYTINPAAPGPAQFDARTGALWPFLRNTNLYFCPRDRDSRDFTLRGQQSSTYVMNGAVNGYGRANYPTVKLSRMPPSGVVFWEPDETNIANFNDGASSPNEGLTRRHNGCGIYGQFDGAVSQITQARWNIGTAQTNKNQYWCYPDTPNGR